MEWTRKKLISEYLEFFKSKGHKIIPSASLIPENDPTVLFTTAGMHPLVPYLLGNKHPLGKRLVNVQKCIRTTDIDEVGDLTHNTFFEMLGNWSLGDYWKKESIEFSYEFLTKVLKLEKERLGVTCFAGDKDASKDSESEKVWLSLRIPKERIAFLGKKDNWWGPAGNTGPCGPDTEMFYWASNEQKAPKRFDPSDKHWVEIWNNVFMQYNKTKEGKFLPLTQKNVDTGMGVERTLMVLNGLDDIYEIDAWKPIIDEIENLSGKKYYRNEKIMRVIADHIKAAVFLFDEGISPYHKERGYVLRRLTRRAIVYGKKLDLRDFTSKVAESVLDTYPDYLKKGDKKIRFVNRSNKEFILDEIDREEATFNYTIENGLKVLRNIIAYKSKISAQDAFLLYQSYGFPIELTQEVAKEKNIKVDIKGFQKELAKHQELSRTSSSGFFKSGLADHSEKTTRLHTATHLLNEALRQVLGKEVRQRGSNITSERLRFDFNFSRKLTEAEIEKVQDLVNKKISEKIEVKREEMSLKKALSLGAQAEFGAKYPDIVSVYSIGNFSKEICTGPHVKNTSEIGNFKITKEESSAAGIRRIKAVVE